MLAPLLGGLALWAAPAAAAQPPAGHEARVVIAVLPFGTTVSEIAAVPGVAPGLVSAGLGSVPRAQTWLDTSQGNRVNETLYDGPLPPLEVTGGRVPPAAWQRVLERAESAPAQIVPGLLGSTLEDAGIPVAVDERGGLASLIGVDRDGAARAVDANGCSSGCGPGLTVTRLGAGQLAALAGRLGPDDTLIAIADGTDSEQQLLPAGVAGLGAGDLTSDSTRTDGLVISTDIAPTVLDRLGVAVPSEVKGSAIEVAGDRDPEGVAELESRLGHRPSRDTVVLLPLGIWLLATGLAALAWGRSGARTALRLLALACAWTPLLLLVLAAPDTGPMMSALVVGICAPLLALAADRAMAPCGALALACGLSVAAYAVDVVAGSPLTAFSVLGPNPGAGVRFFGIGNELEAILTTLTLVGTGAWLENRGPPSPRAAAGWFVGVALAAVAAFAPGRFGADVGAAIVLGVGAATAAVLALRLERRRAIAIVAGGGLAALLALIAVDLVLGGAHLTRSVLGAGDAGDVLDVLDRRVTLMAHTFTHPVYPELLVATVVLLIAAVIKRRQVLGWFEGRWAARAGFLGALAGVLVGTVANDSGSVLLVIGTVYLAVFAGFFWASRKEGVPG